MKKKILYILFLLLKSVNSVEEGGDAKIINGRKASIKEYAYVVSISDGTDSHICGGSIITSYHVLTACHCTRMNNTGEIFDRIPNSLTVRAGSDNILRPSEIIQERGVSVIVTHPKCRIFDFSAIYDVSILRMKNHLEFNDYVQPIKLPFSLSKNKDYIDISALCRHRLYCRLAGWGRTSDTELSDILQEIAIPLKSYEKCKIKIFNATEGEIQLDNSETEICTDVVEGKDACLGDSGGGLKCGKFLIGIVSWGFECGNKDYPSIFTNVLRVKNFVRESLENLKSSASSIFFNIFIIILLFEIK